LPLLLVYNKNFIKHAFRKCLAELPREFGEEIRGLFKSVFYFVSVCYNNFMFANPEQNIAQLGLREGMRVADLGSGTGFYVKIASQRVGHTGKVYAIEVQKDLIKKLESELKEKGITNVDCIWG
jgi:ubiquinone/menaquinone biosynthesis C-methylase UbiE